MINSIKNIKNFGIGVDIESIGRFRKLDCTKDKLLLDRIFTKKELDYCFSKKNPASHLAARYAGKEAIAKALSGMGRKTRDYNLLEIFNNKNGVPKVKIRSNAGLQVSVSLSHSKDSAIAFAVVVDTN